MIELATKQIKADEGLRLSPYECSAGKLTIGFGRNLEDRGISLDEAEIMLANDIRESISELSTFPWFSGLSERRQAALVNMHFNIGHARFLGFKRMIAALEIGDYPQAGAELLDSKYAQQVRQRARRLATMLVNG